GNAVQRKLQSPSETQSDAAAGGEAVLAAGLELAARLRSIAVDRASETALETPVERAAAIAAAFDLDVAVAPDDQRRVERDDGIVRLDRDRVIGRATARAAGLTIERRLEPLARWPPGLDRAPVGLPARRRARIAPRAIAAARVGGRAQPARGRM